MKVWQFVGAIVSAALVVGCANVVPPEEFLTDRQIKMPDANGMTVCAGDTCARRREIVLTQIDRQKLRSFFDGDVSHAREERTRLKMAIDWLEHRTGVHTKRPPVERLKGRKLKEAFWNYHSCIDDTSNTTIFLITLQKMRLMRLHDVAGPAYRGLMIDGKVPHFTAVIREKKSNVKYSIDTWLYTTGEPVIVKPLSDWLWEF